MIEMFHEIRATLNDKKEQDKSFLDCKRKHRLKSGATPEKFSPLQSVTYRIP